MRWTTLAALAICLGCATAPASAEQIPAPSQATHPMDALTPAELAATVKILKGASKATEASQFPTLTLHEPDKGFVRGWVPGKPFERKARVTVLDGGTVVHNAVVNITTGSVESFKEIKGKFPRLLTGAFTMSPVIRKDSRFVEALKKRGYTDPEKIKCTALTPGPIDNPKYAGRWVAYALCNEITDKDHEFWSRPIEGLMPVVDLAANKVIDVVDLGAIPMIMEQSSLRYHESRKYRTPSKPIEINNPAGSNIVVNGSTIKWDNWSFHMRIDGREGPIVSLVNYDDHGTKRPIVYEMAPAEMFVPYMDPEKTWSWRAYMDVGEYGFGINASVLHPGADCPVSAKYFSLTIAGDKGEPLSKPNAVCIFEQPTGDPIWRHAGSDESRANVQLVVRSAPQVGNYDYLIDYIFNTAGDIDVRVGATGIDAVKGVASAMLSDPTAAKDTEHGTLIAKGLVGTNHDHYISFRVDMDVDGGENRAVFDSFEPRMFPKDSFRRSSWSAKSETISTAGPLKYSDNAGSLRIENAGRKNAMGYPTSYQLYPGHGATSLLTPDDPIQKRASWSRYSTWLSIFDPEQRNPSGPFPNLDSSGDGLAQWTKGAQNINGKDIVFWYTVGFRHIPRAEDWPVMPTIWHGFRLRPVNFFDSNPALDLLPRAPEPR